jgi:hypothetical protein
MLEKVSGYLSKAITWASSWLDASTQYNEIRLAGFGLVVSFSCYWLTYALRQAQGHISMGWSSCFAALCGLVSIAAWTLSKS